ncbi:MAG: hypothetical protein ACR2MY_00060 [Candidatus Dormibacteria bacterium]
MAQWQGIEGLVECLSEHMLGRATGAAALSDDARIYLVFGHPLHATLGDSTGMPAVDAVAGLALAQPDVAVTWIPGVTAGKAHSLTASDHVVDHLRSRAGSLGGPAQGSGDAELGHMEDLGLRRMMSEQGAAPISDAPLWTGVIASISALLAGALHRHSAGLVESIARAEPDPRSILMAIDRTRSMPVRMVSPARVAALLDEAEVLVKEKMTAG